jgi:hypothetical protein
MSTMRSCGSGDWWIAQPVPKAVHEIPADGQARQGEYRVDGDGVWARNDVGVRSLPREKDRADVAVARQVLHLLDHGL